MLFYMHGLSAPTFVHINSTNLRAAAPHPLVADDGMELSVY